MDSSLQLVPLGSDHAACQVEDNAEGGVGHPDQEASAVFSC
jgi:hypothetical protein